MVALLIVNIMITLLFSIFCLIYLLLTLYYVSQNIFSRKQKIISYWMDYFLIVLILLISSILYIYYQNRHLFLDSDVEATKCINDKVCFVFIQLIVFIAFLTLNNLLVDNIQSIMVCVSIYHTLRIKAQDIKTLNANLSKYHLTNETDKRRHLIEFGLFALFYLFIIYFVKEVFCDTLNQIYMLRFLLNLYRTCQIIIMSFTIVTLFAMSKYKNRILDRSYSSGNRKLRSIYLVHVSKMAYYDDFITYKSIIDFIGNIPIVIFVSTGRFSYTSLWVAYLMFCLYIFFNGSVFAYVDAKNKVKAKKSLFGLIRLDYAQFSFGEKEKAKLYDDNCLDLKCEDVILINELNLPLIESVKLFDSLDISFNSIRNDYLQTNFFILAKMLYLFFQANAPTYIERNKSNNEKLKKIPSSSEINILNKVNSSFKTKFQHSLTFSEFSLLSPIDNKKHLEEFISNIKPINTTKVDFNIVSLETNKFLLLYPYYQLQIEDILASLNINFNSTAISSWYDSKSKDKTFNYYSTHDSMLSFEIYDSKVFSEEKLALFSYKYYDYIIEKIISKRKTFIPYVLGIFLVRYCDYNKYVILYRNPCVCTRFLFFNTYSLTTFCEKDKEMIMESSNSTSSSENEKQVMQSYLKTLDEDLISKINNILASDIKFIKEMKFICFPKANLVIMNETESSNENEVSSISEMINKQPIKLDSVKSNLPLPKLSDYDSFMKAVNHKLSLSKMENGSSVITICDLLNLHYANGKKIVFKIFFSELFRINIDLKSRENFRSEFATNRSYCKL